MRIFKPFIAVAVLFAPTVLSSPLPDPQFVANSTLYWQELAGSFDAAELISVSSLRDPYFSVPTEITHSCCEVDRVTFPCCLRSVHQLRAVAPVKRGAGVVPDKDPITNVKQIWGNEI